MQRIILHIDLNNFFASAALLKNPTLKSLPVAVCGDSEKRHGIVLAKNYIAKGFGVKTAETIWEAKRKCPGLVMLPADYKLYEKLSRAVQLIYYRFSDKIEPFGIDECWVDISNKGVDFKNGELIAHKIRKTVKEETGLTVSIGVSFNKVFSKLGSDMKKPDAVTVITPECVKDKVWPLSCGELLMVGRSTLKTLKGMGIFTIGDLALADFSALKVKLGKNGVSLKKMALGEDNSLVTPFHIHEKPKSIGNSATAERDLTTREEVFSAFLDFSETVCERLRKNKLLAGSVGVHIRTFDLETKEFQMPLDSPTDISFILAKAAIKLFDANYNFEKPLRAVGVRALNLVDQNINAAQLSLFADTDFLETQKKIEKNISEIRDKYGREAIKRASSIDAIALPSSPGFYKK